MITQQSAEQLLINFSDNTRNQNYQTTVAYTSSTSSAEWIEEASSNGVSSSFARSSVVSNTPIPTFNRDPRVRKRRGRLIGLYSLFPKRYRIQVLLSQPTISISPAPTASLQPT